MAIPDAGELDLGSLFDQMGRPIFLCLVAFGLWLACTGLYLLREPFLVPQRAFQGVCVGAWLIGAVFPSRRMAAAVGALTLATVILLFATVRANLA